MSGKNDKELYQQKKQAQLDEWKAELDKLKAKASKSSADAQLDLNNDIRVLDREIEQIKAKLSAIADASEDAWEPIKDGVDSAMGSMKSAFNDATAKFKK